ncbi:MAG: MFS transporter [Pseudomonadales bacterium]|nr:MFS transporter [Pseudomonadales bacterium]MCP5183597.1 MFS transporter [Pseudomonadales bacterium]
MNDNSSSTLAPMRIPVFRNLWFASMVSNLGGLIQGVGAAWAMTSMAVTADMVALVQTSTTLPVMLLSLVAGAVADGFPRRTVMLGAQLFMFLMSCGLALTAWLGLLGPWQLLGFTFLIGCGGAFNIPAWQAAVGDMVPRDRIAAAVLLNSVSFNVTRSVGPAAGGAIVAAAGAAAAFAINAVSYLGLIGVLWRWKPDIPPNTMPRENLLSAMSAGMRYVAMSPNIGKVLVRGFVFGAAAIVILALLPLIVRDLLGGNAVVYGTLLGAFGMGAVAGAFISRRARQHLSNEALVQVTIAAFIVCSLISAESRSAWFTGFGLLLGGAAWVMALSLFNTSVQMSTPRWVVGRALSLYQMATFGGMALGSWLWGNIAEHHGVDSALWSASVALVLASLIGIRLRLPGSDALNLDPLNRWREPQTELDIQPRSGPVAILVEYEIEPEQVDAFLDAMSERHRIRRRDGAHHWSLARDTENVRLWIERYELPTWADYVRLHMRTTQADAHVGDRIRALHAGEEPIRVRRLLLRNPVGRSAEAVEIEVRDLH